MTSVRSPAGSICGASSPRPDTTPGPLAVTQGPPGGDLGIGAGAEPSTAAAEVVARPSRGKRRLDPGEPPGIGQRVTLTGFPDGI
jgi:hypothetical protein